MVYNFRVMFEYVRPGNVQNNMQGKEFPSVWASQEMQQVDGAYLRRSKQYALQFVFLNRSEFDKLDYTCEGRHGIPVDFKRGYVYVLFVYNIRIRSPCTGC